MNKITPRMLDADEADVLRATKTKLAELNLHDKTQQLARGRLLALSKAPPTSYTNHYDIFYIQQSARMLLCCAVPVSDVEIEDAIERLYHAIDVKNSSPDGNLLLLSDLETADAYRVAVPIKALLACHSYECVMLESGWYLSTMHHGDYYSIGIAYDRLLCYAEEKGHTLAPPFLERYLLDAENTTDSAQYLTQIFVQLTPCSCLVVDGHFPVFHL